MKLRLSISVRKSVLSCLALVVSCTLSSGAMAFATEEVLSEGAGAAVQESSRQVGANINYSNYETVSFEEIAHDGYANGGAIYGKLDGGSSIGSIILENNGSVLFSGNSAVNTGGAISGGPSDISLSGNDGVSFIGNESFYGGAIHNDGGSIALSGNGTVDFTGNTATHGGAIYARPACTVTLSGNGSVVFSDNSAAPDLSSQYAWGGAIYAVEGSSVVLSNNTSVEFSGNKAIHTHNAAFGAAIYTTGNLTIENNDSVVFYQNVEVLKDTYRLRSIVADGSGATISLSAAEGEHIIFHDSIYVGTGYTCNLNGGENFPSQKGDIIFTGATTEADLLAVKGSAGTEEEILASRTTEVKTVTNLYGGRLRVEEGAIFHGRGITVHEGSEATVRVKDAELNHAGYDLVFNAGTTLEVLGDSYVAGNIVLSGATLSVNSGGAVLDSDLSFAGDDALRVDFAGQGGATSLNGSTLSLQGGTSLWLTNCGSGDGKTYALFADVSAVMGENGVLSSEGGAISGYFDTSQPGTGFWKNATLQLTEDGTLQLVRHDQEVKAAVQVAFRRTANVGYHYYEGVSFVDIDSSEYYSGGAIYGELSSIRLDNNGSVLFSGNSSLTIGGAICGQNSSISLSGNGGVELRGNRSFYGGAIYGEGGSVTVSDNGAVDFGGNVATYGGAIYACSACEVTLSGNGSVVFSSNSAAPDLSSQYAQGGAIYAVSGSSVVLRNNGIVEFSGNKAVHASIAAQGAAIYTLGSLAIENNASVVFYQNAEIQNNTYRLRSIVADGSGATISLSAAEGNHITFRDSIYVGTGYTCNLNGGENAPSQKGDIIFTGATTEADLLAVKGSAGTEEEILASRTTEMKTVTNLYGGRLRVEEGAVFRGRGITVHEGSDATVRVKDAELNHAGYNLVFNAGTALEVAGNSTIRGNVNLKADSLFKLEQAASLSLHDVVEADTATLTVHGTAYLEGNSTLNAGLTLAEGATLDMAELESGAVTLNGSLTFGEQVTIGDNLLALLEDIKAQTEGMVLFTGIDSLTLPDVVATTTSIRLWAGSVFSNLTGQNHYLDYKADTGTLSIVYNIPEPATATLSLLALAALTARRRRK